jgi:hypothetical protein
MSRNPFYTKMATYIITVGHVVQLSMINNSIPKAYEI